MQTPEVSERTKHLVLYAKNHYVVTETLKDLWAILCVYSGLENDAFIDREGVMLCVDDMVDECNVNEQIRFTCNRELWRGYFENPSTWGEWRKSVTFEEVLRSKLSMVRHLTIHHIPWLKTARADAKYLPITPAWLEKMKQEQAGA